MFYTIPLATAHPAIPVWLGTTAGVVCSDTLSVLFFKVFKLQAWEKLIRFVSSLCFITYGLTFLYHCF